MKIISEMKTVYRNYGEGVNPWLITFVVLVVVALIGWVTVGIQMFASGQFYPAPAGPVAPIAWLASSLAVVATFPIRDTLLDNYRIKNSRG